MCSRSAQVAATIVTLMAIVSSISSFRAQDGGAHKAAGGGVAAVRAHLARLQLLPSQRRRDVSSKLHLEALPVPRFASSQQAAKTESATQGQLPRPRMAWEEVTGASGYEWQLWTGKSCRGYLVSAGTTPPTDMAAEATDFIRPLADGPYFWRVRALGDGIVSSASPWSCGAAFQIGPLGCSGQGLDAPSGLMADGQSCGPYIQTSDNHPILQWGGVSSASGYHYEVWTGIDCTGTLAASGTVDASRTSASLSYLENGSYFWRVKALGDGSIYCDGPWSTTCSFTVGVPSCGGTYLSSPNITSLVEWDTSGSPYVISGQLLVDANGMLTIDAGVIVKFAPGASALVNGTLIINGTSSSRVVFGSLNDNTLCGPSPGGSGEPQAGDWTGVSIGFDANVLATNLTIRHASTGLDIGATGNPMFDNLRVSFCQSGIMLHYTQAAFTNTLVESCSNGYGVDSDCVGDTSSFTNLDLYNAPLLIEGYSEATFVGGMWNGGGIQPSAGYISYNSGTPDPSFEGITIQNMGSGGQNALEIMGNVSGSTRWQGIPFWVHYCEIGSAGRVDASGTTLLMDGGLDVLGQFYLGASGSETVVQGGQDFPGSWPGITYESGSSGSVASATIKNGFDGLRIDTSGAFSCSNTRIESCVNSGLNIFASGVYTFTSLDLYDAPLYISGNCRPTFMGGTWDGAGMRPSAGMLDYGQGTPDPAFTNITIQNMGSGGQNALEIMGNVSGSTRWQGIPFWVHWCQIAGAGRVDAYNTTLLMENGLFVEFGGRLNLGRAGTATDVRPAYSYGGPGAWQGISFSAAGMGQITNATIREADTALEVATNSLLTVSGTTISSCNRGVWLHPDQVSFQFFTNLDLFNAPLFIEGNARPTFTGGTWDGGGVQESAGLLIYGNETPDPAFSGITIQNMATGGQNALEITGNVEGATHWKGIPFWLRSTIPVQSAGRVDSSNATLLMQGSLLDVSGQLYLGQTGTTTEARSALTSPSPGDWQGIVFEPGSSGAVTNATISHASQAIEVATAGPVVMRDSRIFLSQTGIVTMGDGAPLIERTAFADDTIAVLVNGSAAPDLGGGGLGSTGFNTLVGGLYAVQNESTVPIAARANWWGCATTTEMDAGSENITAIYDHADNASSGVVDYAGWLGTRNRLITAAAQNRDVVLAWPQEPTGTLSVFKGTDPQDMTLAGTTVGASWLDPGALDDPSPLTFYRVDGPCP